MVIFAINSFILHQRCLNFQIFNNLCSFFGTILGTVLHEETKTEAAGDASSIDGFSFGQFFDEVSRIINNMFSFARN